VSVVAAALSIMASTSVAQMDYLVYDADGNANSGTVIHSTLSGLGFVGTYATSLGPYINSLDNYCSIWICLGVFPESQNPWGANPAWDDSLVSYLTNHGGNIYMEGGDCWFNDPPFNVRSYFDISGDAGGSGDLSTINGVGGTFTAGMSYAYSGDNSNIDHISPTGSGYTVFNNASPAYGCGVANDPGGYMTVGTSFEFGGLVDGAYTKADLADAIMTFFGCTVTVPNYDIATLEIVNPDWFAVPGQATAPQVRFRNVGLNDATGVTATVTITPGGYTSSRTISISSGGELVQAFDNWTPGAAGQQYTLCAYHTWAQDERRGNDTLCQSVRSWDGTWEIHSSWANTVPTINGYIQTGEWTDATMRDISDLLGRLGSTQSPGAARAYFKNDADNLYIAFDGVFDAVEEDDDIFGIYFEDNGDGAWPSSPDSSEGRIQSYHHPEPIGTWHSYMPRITGVMTVEYYVSVNGVSLFDSAGHFQVEYAIPMGASATEWFDLDAGDGDTVGCWIWALEEEGMSSEGYAWWPTSSQIGFGELPDLGDLILASMPAIDLTPTVITSPGATVTANVPVAIEAFVKNVGNATRTFDVAFLIDGGSVYGDTVTLSNLVPGDSALAQFTDWNPGNCSNGTIYDLEVISMDPGDINSVNDTLTGQTECVTLDHDLAIWLITWPPDNFHEDSVYAPGVDVRNLGSNSEAGVSVVCWIDSLLVTIYEETLTIATIGPGLVSHLDFPAWTAGPGPNYDVCAKHLLPDDDPSNDSLCKTISIIGIEEEFAVRKPLSFALFQNTPNPLRNYADIRYQLAEGARVSLSVYDAVGRLVATLVDEEKMPGDYSVRWSGKADSGDEVQNGIYFYRLDAGDFRSTLKLAVVR